MNWQTLLKSRIRVCAFIFLFLISNILALGSGLTADLVISGAGPGGLAATLLHARQGKRVILLEKRSERSDQSLELNEWGSRRRVVQLDPSLYKFLISVGVSQEIFTSTNLLSYQSSRNLRLHLPLVLPGARSMASSVFNRTFGPSVIISDLERELLRLIQLEKSVEVIFNEKIRDFQERGHRVEILLSGGKTVECGHLLIAEGKNSPVPELLEISRIGFGEEKQRLLALLQFENSPKKMGRMLVGGHAVGEEFLNYALLRSNSTGNLAIVHSGEMHLKPEKHADFIEEVLAKLNLAANIEESFLVNTNPHYLERFVSVNGGVSFLGDVALSVDFSTGAGVSLSLIHI